MPLATQSAVSIALSAKALLMKHGWTRAMLQDEQGRLCIMGAANTAVTGSWGYPHFLIADMQIIAGFAAAFNQARQQLFPGDYGCSCRMSFSREICEAVNFNNAKDRTAGEIHQVLDAMAA